jgi:hypothetical protein
MITKEMLTADTVLGSLTEEQMNAICTLSKNDEDAVIGGRFREVYNQLDETIARETGIARNGDEKTYNYLERAAKALAAKANSVEGLNVKINELTRERDKFKKAVEEGAADEQLKKQLAQAQTDLENVRKQYDTLKTESDTMKVQHAQELFGLQVDSEIRSTMGGIKFKSEFPKAVIDTIVNQAIEKIKGMSPEYMDDGKGGKVLAFKDDKGVVLRNSENHLYPYTAGELLTKELKAMGIVDEGRQAAGAGSKPNAGGAGGAGAVVDITMARTQTEAQEIIARTLMQQGLVNGSDEFQAKMDEAWRENNVSALPIQ